ncbi:MAG: response regulator transcription factor, partial [Spirochaetales bacterium]|nr:response regulator transcription factor [Spirochaetales bacterium]
DEKDIVELIDYNLQKEGYKTIHAFSGEDALIASRQKTPDLIILDLMLPGIDGFEVCKVLKQDRQTRNIPIIMLTARGDDLDQIVGLELGADDYVTKPFSPKVLITRIKKTIQRVGGLNTEKTDEIITAYGLELDPVRHQTIYNGKKLDLSVTEFNLLRLLAENPGRVFSRNQIIVATKGDDYPVTERSVDVQILGLRKKLGDFEQYIETVRGVGYRLKDV